MSNKTSDKNVANEERLNNFANMTFLYGHRVNLNVSGLKGVQQDIKNVLAELEQKDKRIKELEEERESVLDLIFEYGQIDGEHHKTWVIDQIVRILTKDKYNEWIKNYVYDEETGDTYSWDKGIAP